MGKNIKTSAALLTLSAAAIAASYSYLPTLWGKLQQKDKKIKRQKSENMCARGFDEDKTLYLTFDDGPDSAYTERLLNMLKKYNIRATFFVVAHSAAENPALIKRMAAEGHVIGLHSLSHKSAMLQLPHQTRRDFKESLKIMAALGVKINYYRPPWGQVNLETPKCIREFGLQKILWDVMAEDWREDTSDEVIQYKLLKRSENGDIICLHDGRGKNGAPLKTLAALDKTIPLWLEQGYEFKTIGEEENEHSI